MTVRRKWSFVGIPDHEGVRNVGGRLGAASGPHAFWQAFARLNGAAGVKEGLVRAFETEVGGDARTNLRNAASSVKEASLLSVRTVVVGGGHDHGFSQLQGIRDSLKKKGARIGCINLDAHLDLRDARERVTSGSPYWIAIEEGVLDPSRFVEFGIQKQCNGPALWEYAKKKRVRIVGLEEMRGKVLARFQAEYRKLAAKCDAVVLSFDLDCVAEAFAPGVSAPQSEGFTPMEVLSVIGWAGAQKKCISLGIFELNPIHDIDGKTARLAATAAWRYLAGV